LERRKIPVNSRKAVGTARLWVAQNMSVFLSIYKPGSIMIGFARWNLPNPQRKTLSVSLIRWGEMNLSFVRATAKYVGMR
jgi:hypothetical protein